MTRVVSAVALAALVLLTIWGLPWWATVAVASLAAAQGGRELGRLAKAVPGLTGVGAALVVLAFVAEDPRIAWFHPGVLVLVLIGILIVSGCLSMVGQTPSEAGVVRIAAGVFAPLYVGLPLGTIAWVRSVDAGGAATLTWFLLVVTASDSGQYYVGRTLGRRRLAPTVSPGKTVEGAAGGLVVAIAAGALAAPWGLSGVSTGAAAGLACLLAVAGMAGDLFESFLKRSAGVKDSAALIPGHGGLLDRIDGYLFAAPVFYVALRHVL